MGLRAHIAAACLALATPSAALELAPQCTYVTATGKLVPWNEGGEDDPGIYVERMGEGIAGWTVHDYRRDRISLAVLQHCASGRELAVVFSSSGNRAAEDRWRHMVDSDAPFTFSQVAQEMERLGAKAHFRRGLSIGRCACEELQSWQ